jgi:hypothetical protein
LIVYLTSFVNFFFSRFVISYDNENLLGTHD